MTDEPKSIDLSGHPETASFAADMNAVLIKHHGTVPTVAAMGMLAQATGNYMADAIFVGALTLDEARSMIIANVEYGQNNRDASLAELHPGAGTIQ